MSGYKTLSAYSDEESTPSYQNEPVVENVDDIQIKKKYGTAAIAYGAVIAVTMVLAFSSTTGRNSQVDKSESTMPNVMQSSELKDALVASTDFNKLNTDVQNQLTGPMAASPPVPVLPTIPAPVTVQVMEEPAVEKTEVAVDVKSTKQQQKQLPKSLPKESDNVIVLTAEQLAAAKATATKDAVALPVEEGATPPLPGTALFPPKKNSGLGQVAGLYTTGGSVMKSGYAAASPTKSPSSGLHKPTWKPSAKPVEHASKQGAALPRNLKSAAQKAAKEAAGTHYYEIKAKTTKAVPDSGLNSAESDAETEESEPVEVSLDADFEKKEDKRESRKADKKAREETESTGATVHTWNGETRRALAGSPTKSPSSGLHKPTWKPSSKPAEHRALQKKDDKADPCHDGLSPRCTPPTSKPVEHRSLAGSPTKSPSSGLHKPTWRPSAKPAEHRTLKSAAQKAAKEAAGTHYYEIKAKTTKAVPDSGLNSAESDAETEESEPVEVSLDADFEKKEDKRESRKADKKAREETESTGATVHTWNGETRRALSSKDSKDSKDSKSSSSKSDKDKDSSSKVTRTDIAI